MLTHDLMNTFTKAIRSLKAVFRYGIKPIISRRLALRNSRIIQKLYDGDQQVYSSQFQQDQFFDIVLFSKNVGGVFIDIGAHDGVTGSNSYFLEKTRGWTGVCFEPNPKLFEVCAGNRVCRCENFCITKESGTYNFAILPGSCDVLGGIYEFFDSRHLKRVSECLQGEAEQMKLIPIRGVNLTDYLKQSKISKIDLLCVDVEGAELLVLDSVDFSQIVIEVICVENNYHGDRLCGFLHEKGFDIVARLECDEVYCRKCSEALLKFQSFLAHEPALRRV